MKKLSFFLLLLILLLVIISHVHSQRPPPTPPPKPELMWYVLSWPPNFCISHNNNAQRPGRCEEPIPQHEFTLHGLWPADKNGKTIDCKKNVPQDWDKLFRPIENKLVTFWPTLKEGQDKREIWKHEWKKHGVCGGRTAQQYFQAAISINDKIEKNGGNLFYQLKTSGIIACDSLAFHKDDIIEAVQKVFFPPPPPPLVMPNVYLRCVQIDERNKTHGYMNEVILCTNLAGSSFVTCPPQGRPKNCDQYNFIMLPQAKPQRHLRFVLQWPPTYCIEQNSKTPRVRCQEPIPQQGFTLNGLWHADGQGEIISNCPKQPEPNWNLVFTSNRENQLTTFWSPLLEQSQKRELWKEEWRSHGVCGGKLTKPEEYFDTAIKINNDLIKGNLFNYLKTSGIIASDSLAYSREDIVKAIRKVFPPLPPPPPPPPHGPPPPTADPLNVYLTCFEFISNKKRYVYLKEVTLCTNMIGTKFVSCPPQRDEGIKTCSTKDDKIMLPLPKPQPRILLNQLMEYISYV